MFKELLNNPTLFIIVVIAFLLVVSLIVIYFGFWRKKLKAKIALSKQLKEENEAKEQKDTAYRLSLEQNVLANTKADKKPEREVKAEDTLKAINELNVQTHTKKINRTKKPATKSKTKKDDTDNTGEVLDIIKGGK